MKKKKRKRGATYAHGTRISLWVPADLRPRADEIQNLSRFFQIALRNAVGVMTWAMLKDRQPENYYDVDKFEDFIDEYNLANPPDKRAYQPKRRDKSERVKRNYQDGNTGSDSELW